jgi:hypothetical protein
VETNGTGAVTCTFAKYELFYTLVNSTPEIDKSITAAMNTGLGINMYHSLYSMVDLHLARVVI